MASAARSLLGPVARIVRRARAWSQGAAASVPPLSSGVQVSYGHTRIPGPHDLAAGGIIKLQYLQREFANSPHRFNLLYLVTSNLPEGAVTLARWAKKKGARVIVNQNGVAYRAWYGEGWERVNAPMRDLLAIADHVFYQSAFCKQTADRFAGTTNAPWEIRHNAIDEHLFTPGPPRTFGARKFTLLLAGSQDAWYRFEIAVRTLAELRSRNHDARLIVTGRLGWRKDPAVARQDAERLLQELEIGDRVELTGRYTQADAPALYRRADILIHTKYNDPCPSVVVEAMACGLPVAFSATGGVLELVGDAGAGVVPAETSFDRDVPPPPEEMAHCVEIIARDLSAYSARARARVLSHLSLDAWMARHRAVFNGRPS
jgi:glycosyltransferase involved in cell wall biosynthesis